MYIIKLITQNLYRTFKREFKEDRLIKVNVALAKENDTYSRKFNHP